MKIQFYNETLLDQGRKLLVKVKKFDLFHISTTIELYEGIAIPRVIDQELGIVEILTTKDHQDTLREILKGLKEEIELEIL